MAKDWFVVSQDGTARVLALAVPPVVDSADVDRLHEAVLAEIAGESGSHWIVDLSAMSYIGSSLLGLMVNVRQRIRQTGGKLVLCGMSPKLHQVFRTCSLERLFIIRAGRSEAMEALTR